MAFPPSDHCDGSLFFNPATEPPPQRPAASRGLLPILRWRFGGTRQVWPRDIADPPPPGDPHALPAPGTVSVTFIGHSSFMLRVGALTLLTDPVFSDRCSPVAWLGPKRARPPGRRFADLPRADLVLVSHNHYDHMDLPSLRAIVRRDDPLFVTPLGNARHLAKAGARRVVELDWWQSHRLDNGTVLTATPARHFSARTPFDRNRALWSGFMIAPPDTGQILFAGDSGHGPHWQQIHDRLGPAALALLPIGAYDPRHLMAPVHVDPDEAVEAFQALGAHRAIGMHFGTFQLTDEAIDAPESGLSQAMTRRGLAGATFSTLGFGETRNILLRQPR